MAFWAELRRRNVVRVAAAYLYHWRETGGWGDFRRPLGPDDFECS